MIRAPRHSIRYDLMGFGVALLAPLLILAPILANHYAKSERAWYEREAQQLALRTAASIDRELAGILATAQALATDRLLQRGDFEAFQERAADAIRAWAPGWSDALAVVVRDREGRQVANTRVPWGTPLPAGNEHTLDAVVIATGRPQIQDLFVGATAQHLITSVRVPVMRGGEVAYVLSIGVDPGHFADVLTAEAGRRDWRLTILDGNDRVIARTRNQERLLGAEAPPDFRAHATGDAGVWTGTNLDGDPVLGAFARSQLSRWRAYVGVPLAIVEAPLRRSLLALGAGAVALLALSFLLARYFSRRISRPMRALTVAAGRLGRGEPVGGLSTGLTEVDEVGQAMASAAQELGQREAALKASESRLRATQENAAVGIVELDREGCVIYANEAELKLVGCTREQLIGHNFADFTHPDHQEDIALFRELVAGTRDTYTIEKRYFRGDGSVGWARLSSKAVRDGDGAFLYTVRVVEDITERKQADARQKLLVDELNHRVKNTLTTVQSVAWQTFRQGLPAEVARERFEARLLALSRTHNLLNESKWEGAALGNILMEELQPYAAGDRRRFALQGPYLHLAPRLAVVLGMAFHELTTNAAKYGALSSPGGMVEVGWRVFEGDDGAPWIRVEWRERGGPPVAAPSRRGFGSRLVTRTVERELAGKLEVHFDPEGLSCIIEVPRGRTLPFGADRSGDVGDARVGGAKGA
jgi:PAS domain S-box-containing protein